MAARQKQIRKLWPVSSFSEAIRFSENPRGPLVQSVAVIPAEYCRDATKNVGRNSKELGISC